MSLTVDDKIKEMSKKNIRSKLSFLKLHIRVVWIFPTMLLIILALLTLFRITGSSVGVYHQILYGEQKDSALLAGTPRPIRSDEWGVATPATLSQVTEELPVFNQTVGNGQDMTITLDVPYVGWGSLFKPHNWSFFVMPAEYAFAFKWWVMGVMLMLASYFFVLSIHPRRYLHASLLSTILFLSPFIQWWYQAVTLLPIAFGLAATALVLWLLKENLSRNRRILLSSILSYVLACFAFVFYIPFLAPVALVCGAFLIGHYVELLSRAPLKKALILRLRWIAMPIVVAATLLGAFLYERYATINAISDTVYPGGRIEATGGYYPLQLLAGYYNIQLQDNTKAAAYYLNQSEASSFILISLFLAPLLIYFWRKERRIDWRVAGLLAMLFLFMLRLFVPLMEPLFNALQFNRIPHNRLIIGIGIINFFLLVIAAEKLANMRRALPQYLVWISAGLAFIIVATVGLILKTSYDGYLESIPKIVLISFAVSLTIWLILKKYLVIGALTLALLSFVSVSSVNPLYRGLGVLHESRLVNTIQSIGDKNGGWVVGDHAAFIEMVPAASGVRSLSGVYAYPQLEIWKPLGTSPQAKDIYNRYAHVFFSIEPVSTAVSPQQAYLDPPALDAFRVHADACSPLLKTHKVSYVLVTTELASPCLTKLADVPYPEITFHIYKIVN